MLKRGLSILLLISLISSSFSRLFVYAGFELNQKYIAENLCVNRYRPAMDCNGKCYLKKQVEKADENEKKALEKNNTLHFEVSFFQQPSQPTFIEPMIFGDIKSSFPRYIYRYGSSYIDSIFRPPKQLG